MYRSILVFTILLGSINNIVSAQCPYGSYNPAITVNWVSNENLDSYTTISENIQNNTGGKLYSDGANVVYSSNQGFQAGDIITIRGNYQNDARRGPLVLTSVGSTALNSGPVMNNAFPANAWGDVTYTIPAGTTTFSQLNVTGETNNGVYVNIDVVSVSRTACYTCDINIAPSLSATTISNICPGTTYNLNSITASNTPAGAELTWHTGTPATDANKIADPAAATGSKFYAAFHSIANSCYSGVNGAATTTVNADPDSDCDGIVDSIDLDDDNDGVPDATEMLCRSGSLFISGNGSITDQNEFNYGENNQEFVINYPYSYKRFTVLFWSIDYQDNFTVTVKLDNGTIVGPLDGRVFYNPSDPAWVARWTTKGYPVASSNVNWNQLLGKYTGSPFNPGDVFYTSPITNNLNKAWGAIEFTVPQATDINGIDEIIISIKPGISVSAFAEVEPLDILPTCTDMDTDGDGIPNRLDLDSDNDGCPDLREAGVKPATDIITPSSSLASHFGIAPGALGGSQLNPTAADANNDGLNDSVDPDLNGLVNYTSTYWLYALKSSWNYCNDKDGDTVSDIDDIDDDNDGILDAVESPACFYTSAEAAIPSVIKTEITSTGTITNLHDNNTATTFAFTATTAANAQNRTIFEITPVTPVQATSILINYSTATGNAFGVVANSVRIDGWNGTSWISLATLAPAAASANLQTLAIPSGSQAIYQKYRLYDINAPVTAAAIREVSLGITASYVASAHPKEICANDTDGDEIPNHQDLDSDGDGCSDAAETGVSGTLLPAAMVNNSGIIYSPQAVAQGPYGLNGFADPLETSTSPESGIYTGSYSNYTNATNSAVHSCPVQPQPKPDVNITYVNIQAAGDVSVNDIKAIGTTYGNVTAFPGYTNPGTEMPVVNSDGTYTFTAASTGVYKFNISVCPPSVSANCQQVMLTIEVLDAYVQTNKPVANPDFATVKMNSTVTIRTLANDRSGNNYTTLQPSSVTITAMPKNGTATVNSTNGNITYTPATGFTGQDTLTYTVCDDASPSPICNSSYQIITVLPSTAANSVAASDDYLFVPQGTTGSGNVLLNDYDPEGNNLTTTAQDISIANKGRFILQTNGTYTFEAESSFSGAINFPYEVCDNGSPVACAKASIYILVPSVGALPLNLLTFTAVKENGNTTGLYWTTTNEINTSHFVIERMIDGLGQWEAIGRVNTTGNGGTSVNSYYFQDGQPTSGSNYYRLKLVDADGKYKYSPVRLVSYNGIIRTTVYPNPADDYVIVQGSGLQSSMLHLYNAVGQQLTDKIRTEQVSPQQLKVELRKLPPGMYILKINGQAVKLIKR